MSGAWPWLAVAGVGALHGLNPATGWAFAAAVHVSGHLPQRLGHAAGDAGLALWSMAMGSLHGAGMMLVPALIPLCLSGSPARAITASGSMALALAAVAVHMAAMLGATALMTALARRLAPWRRRPAQGAGSAPTWAHRKA